MDIQSPTHAANTPKPAGKNRLRNTVANIAVLLIAPVLALLLTSFVFQSYQVDGMSMESTLHDNDRLIVWKGSRTWAHMFGGQYIPNRGDIVIVNQEDLTACGQHSAKVLIKRVIGLPGDQVTYKNGTYTVYNEAHTKGFNPDTNLGYDKNHEVVHASRTSNSITITLGNTELFVSGDNRPHSCDSRSFGPIQSNQIVGKMVMRIYPLSDAERF